MKRYRIERYQTDHIKLNCLYTLVEDPQGHVCRYDDVPGWVRPELSQPKEGEKVLAYIDYGERQEIETYTWDKWWKNEWCCLLATPPQPPGERQ